MTMSFNMEFCRNNIMSDVVLIKPKLIRDYRGYFTRTFDLDEFKEWGLETEWKQFNVSYNNYKHTLRGMHYQEKPYQQVKLVSCLSGSIYDVVLDLRKESPTYGWWVSYTLSAEKKEFLYVPKGFAHGFVTLEDNTEVFYQISEPYNKEADRGLLWNSPILGIVWPTKQVILSDRDKSHPQVL